MKRSEKKKRLKEKQRKQEANRKARLEREGAAPAAAASVPPLTEQEIRDAARDSKVFLEAARGEQTEARERLKDQGHTPGRRITDQRALEMLETAAEYAEYVVEITREILDDVPHARKLEAVEIIREEKARRAAAANGETGSPQQRPRRGHDPVVTLMKLGMQASSLLSRILSKTNPDVVKLARRQQSAKAA